MSPRRGPSAEAYVTSVFCRKKEPLRSHASTGTRCRTTRARCYTRIVPTTRPRYTFTDTGQLQELLDAAQRRWPDVTDRKLLLIRLAEEGHTALGLVKTELDAEERHERLNSALQRIPSLIDSDQLLSDEAWS